MVKTTHTVANDGDGMLRIVTRVDDEVSSGRLVSLQEYVDEVFPAVRRNWTLISKTGDGETRVYEERIQDD